MEISKQSVIYKFLSGHIGRGCTFIPDNLCPYMRRFMWALSAEFIIGFGIAFVVQSMLWLPIVFFLGLRLEVDGYLYTVAVFGVVLWLLVAVIFVIFLWTFLFNKDHAVRKAMNCAANSIGKRIKINIFYQWYKAVHDKICPSIHFK